jgi:hypothetical protein
MKKLWFVLFVVLVLAMVGCPSTQKSTEADRTKGPTNESIAEPVKIIDHQYRGLKDVPDWVTMDQGNIEKMADFKDYFVFKEFVQGKDLNAVKQWAQNFIVDDQISRLVSNRVQSKFAGAMVGTVDGADTYFEKIVKSMTDAKISGTRRHGEYWIQRRYTNPDGSNKDVFEYYILIKVPEGEVKKAVARAFDTNPPQSANEKRASDSVKKIMDSTEDW